MGCKKKTADQRRAWVDCRAAWPRCRITKFNFYWLKCYAPHSIDTITSKRSLVTCVHDFARIKTTAKKAFYFAHPVLQLYIFFIAAKKCAVGKTLQVKLVIVPAFSLIVGNDVLHLTGATWEDSPRSRYHAYIIPSHISVKDILLLRMALRFSFSALHFIGPKRKTLKML